MSKITILIQPPITRFGTNGQPLHPGHTYKVVDSPVIQDLLKEGFATLVVPAPEAPKEKAETPETPEDERAKPSVRTSKRQETVASTSEETSNV
jgi:hypothetical protein